MSSRYSHGVTLDCVQGDIANQPDCVAVVNAANALLQSGGGVAGAIHRAAGPKLAEECSKLAPLRPGQAVITSAWDLPNRYVIHCLGPVYGRDVPSDELLASCYRNALQLAIDNRIASIAFPAISTGAFAYPPEPACRIAVRSVLERMDDLQPLQCIRFVLFSDKDRLRYEKALDELIASA